MAQVDTACSCLTLYNILLSDCTVTDLAVLLSMGIWVVSFSGDYHKPCSYELSGTCLPVYEQMLKISLGYILRNRIVVSWSYIHFTGIRTSIS